MVSDFFTAYTHARNGEAYEIQFNGGKNRGDNFINVIPKNDENRKEYGTTFEVFVPVKLLENIRLQENEYNIVLTDPFSIEDKRERQELFNMMELGNRIYEYLDHIVGEKIFPVKAKLYGFRDSMKYVGYNFPKRGRKIRREIYIDGQLRVEEEPVTSFISREENLSWFYRRNGGNDLPDDLPKGAE